jgi:hypothetical protein
MEIVEVLFDVAQAMQGTYQIKQNNSFLINLTFSGGRATRDIRS